jgi:hypothetical protein
MMQQPSGMGSGGDAYNVQQRSLDIDFTKHILDVNPIQLAFYKVFSGWREVQYMEETTVFGKTKQRIRTRMAIDRYSRVVNESGSNYLYNAVVPLIMPVASTSHLRPIDIYNHWHGGLLTIRGALLKSYYLPSFICLEKMPSYYVDDDEYELGCPFISSSPDKFHEHQLRMGHDEYIEVINPYHLNSERYSEVITKLANMAVVTMGAKEGFKMKELSEMYFSSNMVKQGFQPPQQLTGSGGIVNGVRQVFGGQ